MAVYLREFATQAAYEAAQSSLMLPNVSLIDETNGVAYNPSSPEPPSDPRLIVAYNVTDSSTLTKLFATNQSEAPDITFVEAEIDGVEVDVSNVTSEEFKYQLSIGEHIVKYTLKDTATIGNSTFYGCDRITSVIIPDCVTTIGYSGVFGGCTNLTNVTIGNSVTYIGNGAFESCSSLTAVSIGNSVEFIDGNVFNGCSELISITIPNSVETIANNAFSGCTKLTSVSIGTGISYIYDTVFCNDRNLASITINATTPPTLGLYPFTNNASGRKIYVPSASVEAYKAASGWGEYAADILPIQ